MSEAIELFKAWYRSFRGFEYTGNPTAQETKKVWDGGYEVGIQRGRELERADMLLYAKPIP